MSVLSTTLFINGLPVDYSVSKEKNCFVFEPVFNPHSDLDPPGFTFGYEEEVAIFSVPLEEDVKAQVEEIIQEYLRSE